jgi:DHA1 family bicyclomycin/chloramphenicol resistance-like MFS transporter
LSAAELIGMTAGFMALNSLSIDIMLPALPTIGAEFSVLSANDPPLVIYVYLLAFGIAHLFYGPLSDAYGRKPVLLWSLAGYAVATILCMLAPSFTTFLIARALQGATAACTRVVAVAVVRDLFVGAAMARIMSFSTVVFLAAPMIAPALGQGVLMVAPWRATFAVLLVTAAAVAIWTALRLPETRPTASRTPFAFKAIVDSYVFVIRSRPALGYAIASAFVFGALGAFVGMSQQIFVEAYDLGDWFPAAFAAVAWSIAVASLVNARLVGRFGPHALGHAAILAMTGISMAHGLGIVLFGPPPFAAFLALLCAAMLAFGLIGANFNAIAMTPLGERAGTGAAFFGFATTSFSAIFGALIARAYDGTPGPLIVGQAVLGACGFLVVILTERGRLFRAPPRTASPPA